MDKKKLHFSRDTTWTYMRQFWIYWVRLDKFNSYFMVYVCGILKIVDRDLTAHSGTLYNIFSWSGQYILSPHEDLNPFPPPVFIASCFFLDEGKVQDAIKASQLCLRLLETSVRDELRRLLAFMATAAHPDACRLQKQVVHLDSSFLCTLAVYHI